MGERTSMMRGLSAVLVCAGFAACTSGGGADDPSNEGGGSSLPVLPPSASVTPPGGGCTAGASTPCSCVGGGSGTSSCQLDGTMSACMCSGVVAPGSSGVPSGGAPAAAGAPGGGVAGVGTGEPPVVPDPTGIVMVPPEDVAACAGMGNPPAATEEVEVLEIRTDKVVYGGKEYPIVPGGFVSQATTQYTCFWVEIDMPEKHHIIGWEGAVGGDRTVHHQQVSLGAKPFYLAQQGGLCGLPTVDYTWTGERPTEWTPGQAGYPIGGTENGGKARFLWQVHFEGTTTYTGGFNAYITKNLRKYDAGNFEQGDVRGISIPAMSQATHVATCTPDMTTQKLVHPIYVYASMLHAHLTIRHIKAELKRGGQTVFTFGDETSTGFLGFFDQSFKPHTPCVQLLPGDEIVTTCDYDNQFPFEVVGGEATNQEMCTTFMQYYPRLPGTSNNFCGTIDSTGGFTP